MEIIAKKSYLKEGTNESSYEKLAHIRSCTGSREKFYFTLKKIPYNLTIVKLKIT